MRRIIVAICLCMPAHASPSLSLERVIITGLKPVTAKAEPGGQTLLDTENYRLPSISEWLKHNAAGMTFSEPQGNPFQPELSYRGYGLSGLLGLPQGLALFQNGTRINEAFGDIVNFDLIPEIAIHHLTIVSGANPLFGYNALGGAIASTMKTGFSQGNNAGLEVSGGSFGRANLSAEAGYAEDTTGIYSAIEYSRENGWRYHSPSSLFRLYGDIEQSFENGDIGLSLTWANSDLNGNGSTPEELLNVNRRSIFTHPDNTRNEALFLQTRANWMLMDSLEFSAVSHYRRYQQNTLNGDESNASACPDDFASGAGKICFEEETSLDTIPIQNADGLYYGLNDDGEISEYELAYNKNGSPIDNPIPGEETLFGLYNRSSTISHSGGFNTQLTWKPEIAMLREAIAGFSYQTSTVNFSTSAELGELTETRSVKGFNLFPGAEEGETDPFNISLITRNHNWNLSAGSSFTLAKGLNLEIAANVNGANIRLHDQIGTSLNGTHDYVAFNPALEFSYDFPQTEFGQIQALARYAESNRFPSPAELACADPQQPCRFPNAFISDPPLKQVKVRSAELGFSSASSIMKNTPMEGNLHWSIVGYYSANINDIIFVSAGETIGSGYFSNVGTTQRSGFESSLHYQNNLLILSASYSYINATFQNSFKLFAANHPEANNSETNVAVGDRIPLIPEHSGKIALKLIMPENWRKPLRLNSANAELALYMASSRYLRGDESNQTKPLPGFARLDMNMEAILVKNISLFLYLENLSFAKYETFGLFGEAEIPLQELGNTALNYGPRFLTPAAPFSVYVGLRLKL